MPREIRNRRSENRQKIPYKSNAGVEIPMPDGERRKLGLVDLSVGDLCFESPPGVPRVQSGTLIADALVFVGKLKVECDIEVVRTWRQLDGAIHCGARLYPKSEEDRNELVTLIAALEAFRSRHGSD